jgi:hypothetical protein
MADAPRSLLTLCQEAEEARTLSWLANAILHRKLTRQDWATLADFFPRYELIARKVARPRWPQDFTHAAALAWQGDTKELLSIMRAHRSELAAFCRVTRLRKIPERTLFDQDTPKNEKANVEWIETACSFLLPLRENPNRMLFAELIGSNLPFTEVARGLLKDICRVFGNDPTPILDLIDAKRRRVAQRLFARLPWVRSGTKTFPWQKSYPQS